MSFPRFGPNGAFALFSDERDVPPGWQTTAEDARRMQTLAPPIGGMTLRAGLDTGWQDATGFEPVPATAGLATPAGPDTRRVSNPRRRSGRSVA